MYNHLEDIECPKKQIHLHDTNTFIFVRLCLRNISVNCGMAPYTTLGGFHCFHGGTPIAGCLISGL